VQTPRLYTLTADLATTTSTDVIIDSVNTTIGMRHIDWTSKGGFALNHQPLHIRGFSHHSDFGAVGGAVPDRLNVFRANALRSVGGNTWRTSHNPYRPAVYDILDHLGVLVWDENRDFNMMNTMDMERLVRRDRNHPSVVVWSACNEIECWVDGDANVTGAAMRAATKKWDTTRPLSANLNQLSSSGSSMLPTLNSTLDYLARELDVIGFSHRSIAKPQAGTIHAALPDKPIISSECCSCQTQRGEDYTNTTAGLVYPHAESQAQCMETCMNYSYPYWEGNPSPDLGVIAGTLGVWTLFDYGGEPGPWPTVSSSFGQFDIAGFPKSASYWYRANWLSRVPSGAPGRPPVSEPHGTVRISQAWTAPPPVDPYPPVPVPDRCNRTLFQQLCPVTPPVNNNQIQPCLECCRNHSHALTTNGCEGENVWPDHCRGIGPGFPPAGQGVDVQVFSNAPTVELMLNGKSLGQQPNPTPFSYVNFRNVTYEPGNLTAVGLGLGLKRPPVHTIITAGQAAAIVLSLDAPSVRTGTGTALVLDGHDAALVRATIVDASGNAVEAETELTTPAAPVVTFAVSSGPGRVAGVHNGDAKSHERQAATSRTAYHGLVRAVVRVTVDAAASSSPAGSLLREIDVLSGDGVGTVKVLNGHTGVNEIVVTASAPGLKPGSISIPVSTDVEVHGPLAAAKASAIGSELMFN
jgi:hypothetical protein